jgi:hypothetical protein
LLVQDERHVHLPLLIFVGHPNLNIAQGGGACELPPLCPLVHLLHFALEELL